MKQAVSKDVTGVYLYFRLKVFGSKIPLCQEVPVLLLQGEDGVLGNSQVFLHQGVCGLHLLQLLLQVGHCGTAINQSALIAVSMMVMMMVITLTTHLFMTHHSPNTAIAFAVYSQYATL